MKKSIKKLLREELAEHNNINTELNAIIDKYENLGMSCWVYYKPDVIQVSSIKIKDKSNRKQGLGSSFMNEIIQLCDKHNLLCVLTPDSSETPMFILLKFYSKFGFVKNAGKNKDFRYRETMIRFPKTQV